MKFTEEESLVIQETSEFNVIFIHSKLDDAGLTAGEFRVYAHLSRRASGGGKAWPSIRSMAEACRMNKDTVSEAIRTLEARRMLHREERGFTSTVYKLTPPSTWLVSETEGQAPLSENRGQTVRNGGTVPVRKEGTEGYPVEGNPLKVIHPSRGDEVRLIYAAYPRKQGKTAALKAIAKACKAYNPQTLLERTRDYADAVARWTPEQREFVPYPQKWFSHGMYEDDPAKWVKNGASNSKSGYIEL